MDQPGAPTLLAETPRGGAETPPDAPQARTDDPNERSRASYLPIVHLVAGEIVAAARQFREIAAEAFERALADGLDFVIECNRAQQARFTTLLDARISLVADLSREPSVLTRGVPDHLGEAVRHLAELIDHGYDLGAGELPGAGFNPSDCVRLRLSIPAVFTPDRARAARIYLERMSHAYAWAAVAVGRSDAVLSYISACWPRSQATPWSLQHVYAVQRVNAEVIAFLDSQLPARHTVSAQDYGGTCDASYPDPRTGVSEQPSRSGDGFRRCEGPLRTRYTRAREGALDAHS